MNLAIRCIESNRGKEHTDGFHLDLHPDLKADYVLAKVTGSLYPLKGVCQ